MPPGTVGHFDGGGTPRAYFTVGGKHFRKKAKRTVRPGRLAPGVDMECVLFCHTHTLLLLVADLTKSG